MKKFVSIILLGVLLATPSLHANVKVHFEGDITKTTLDALPKWIEPVSMQEANWLIKIKEGKPNVGGFTKLTRFYYNGPYLLTLPLSPFVVLGLFPSMLFLPRISYKLDIRNLNSGSSFNKNVTNCSFGSLNEEDVLSHGREKLAKKIAKFFEEYNKDVVPPQLVLYSPFDRKEYTTSVEEVTLRLSANDDVELSKVIIYKNGRTYQTYSAAGGNRFSKSLDIPLELGYNKFQVTAYDWMNRSTTKEVTIFRSKGGGDIPRTPDPPELAVKVASTNQTNTLMGGTIGGVVVTIHNSGKGYADNVKVSLSGDQQLCDALGNFKEIEEIAPGDSAVVQFRRRLPDDLEQKQTRLKVSVTADNYPVPEEDALTLSLFPKPEDVDTDIPSSGIRRDGYALVVGISQYQRAQGPQYALNDAEVFSMYAEKVLGIPASNIELMFDEEATWKSLETKVRALGGRSGWRVVYFAGHGSFDVENPRSEKAFLAPYDWDPASPSSLLSVDWLLDQVEPGEGDTTLVILDACFTGGEGRSVKVAARPVVMASLPTEHKSIVMASSEGSQISLENEYARHGMFTYYLLSGLKGKAAGERGWIYLDNLYNYVRDEVKAATNNRQTPVLRGEGEGVKVGRTR